MSASIKKALATLSDRVMGRPGVSGVAVGNHAGQPCLVVYVADRGAAVGLPKAVDGFPVVSEVTGTFRRL